MDAVFEHRSFYLRKGLCQATELRASCRDSRHPDRDAERWEVPTVLRIRNAFAGSHHVGSSGRSWCHDGLPSGIGCSTTLAEQSLQPVGHDLGPLELTFPDGEHRPTEPAQLSRDPAIARDVRGELLLPEPHSGGRRRRVSTSRMAVPEAAMDEDDRVEPGQDQIRGPWQVPDVQPEAVAEPVDDRTDHPLGTGVPTADRGHDLRSLRSCVNISHCE